MALRGPFPLLFLTLVLLATSLAQHRPSNRNQRFLRRHVDFPKTSAPNDQSYCNTMMQRWGLTRHFCKITNTFIHAQAPLLQAICILGGRCSSIWHCNSKVPYEITTCWVVPGSHPGR
ncbi:unnamed protein product, partial [Caretta caretta]